MREVFSFCTNSDLDLHMIAKELQAPSFAMRTYMMRDATVQFYTHLTTLFHYIRKWGGNHYHSNPLAERLWAYTQEQNATIVPHYVPSALNPADLPF